MHRYSYEWVDPEDGEAAHFSDDLYAIYDSKRGFTDPFAWGWDRSATELIVDALNALDERLRQARTARQRQQYDLSDLLS
ncbi:hypothetical protein [Mesorhizobium sp. INR15]|uniref:hypothetical protein n=1 Tax=Mesorhizobium sp. INR15 TaxID=2654248 RepID=UPI0018968F58|nr:hypothetical protein [Mesorhizobium sp. INR15]QPC91469.1 hypothetical protein GA829_13080 [Mesorhizobium sp. INR15]